MVVDGIPKGPSCNQHPPLKNMGVPYPSSKYLDENNQWSFPYGKCKRHWNPRDQHGHRYA